MPISHWERRVGGRQAHGLYYTSSSYSSKAAVWTRGHCRSHLYTMCVLPIEDILLTRPICAEKLAPPAPGALLKLHMNEHSAVNLCTKNMLASKVC